MSAPLLTKTVVDQRRGLIGWTIGLAVIVGAMGALWPTVRDMPDISEFLDNYPAAVRDLFNIDQIATGPGYLNAELFSIIVPAMFIVYAVARGARLLAGEEESRALDVVLASPVPRSQILLAKAVGLVLGTAALGVGLFAATATTSTVLGMRISVGGLAAGSVAMIAIGVEHGLLALAVGAATGRRTVALAVGGAVGVAGYVLFVVGEIVTSLSSWQRLSPFHQVLANGPLGGALPLTLIAVVGVGVLTVAVALPLFERRDVGA